MKKLFRAKGRLFWLENAERERVSGVLAEGRPVLVDVGYELRRLSENKTFDGILAFGDAQWRMPIAPDDAVEARVAGVRTSRYNVLDGYRRRLDCFLA